MSTFFSVDDIVKAYCKEYDKVLNGVIVAIRKRSNEAYVHFIKQDKRLDSWFPVTELSHAALNSYSNKEEHILTRSQHRNDEECFLEDILQEGHNYDDPQQEVTKVRNINSITIGKYTIKSWYYSPYPNPYGKMDHLYICEHCFRYFSNAEDLQSHIQENHELCPPGREIYREGNISIFEIKGWKEKITCQCLCLLMKLFIDNKVTFYDIDGFVFYVLCETDNKGAHIAAFFSKEVNNPSKNVLSCIATLPPYQRKGYGSLCISLSYEISRRCLTSGVPEGPLSDLGRIAFRSYWRNTIFEKLKNNPDKINSIEDIIMLTGIDRADIVDILKEINGVTKIRSDYEFNTINISKALKDFKVPEGRRSINTDYLIWVPDKY